MRLAQSKVHFIGIGGIGMCGLAELLHNMGACVSGSDAAANKQTQRLGEMGVKIFLGQKAENIGDAEVVVFSSAIKANNPEFQEARRRKIPLIPRAEALAEMMRLKRGVAVGGSHGKTTTTSMTASIFLEAQSDPTIVVGGGLDLIKSTARLGKGEWLIAEADESDGSFSRLSPEIVIVTNIDNDHLDHYGTIENLKKAFYDFASRTPFYGLAVVCGDDPLNREVFADYPKRILFYGFEEHNQLRLSGDRGSYTVHLGSERLGDFQLQLPGRHNALNALAALAVGLEADLDFATCARGLARFAGVDRRFQFKGVKKGVDVYDDYGHHPTEIRAVLQGFREKFPSRRLVVVFQPHRYSRTALCWEQFKECFVQADKLFLCDIYPAGESPIPQISSEILAPQIQSPICEHLPSSVDRVARLLQEVREGDVLITVGAGEVWKLGVAFLEA